MATKVSRLTRSNNSPVGVVVSSMLSEAQFQAINGISWVLADGRDVTGSVYATVTGEATIPDLRGEFLRGKNNGRNDGNEDPDGERNLGAFQADDNKSHNHIEGYRSVNSPAPAWGREPAVAIGSWGYSLTSSNLNNNSVTSNRGGPETRPKNIAVNHFIKVNP